MQNEGAQQQSSDTVTGDAQGQQRDHGGQHVNAVLQGIQAEGEAGNTGDGVHADAGHQQADHTGDDALGQAVAGNAGNQADAQDAHGEVFYRSKVGHQLGDKRCADQQQNGREQTAEHRGEQRSIQCLFDFALLGQRVTVKGSGNGGVGAGGVQGNGTDGTAVHTADVDSQQQDNGGSGVVKGVGQGQHQDNTECNAQARDAANDHAENQAAQDQRHIVQREYLRNGLGNLCKIRHVKSALPKSPAKAAKC